MVLVLHRNQADFLAVIPQMEVLACGAGVGIDMDILVSHTIHFHGLCIFFKVDVRKCHFIVPEVKVFFGNADGRHFAVKVYILGVQPVDFQVWQDGDAVLVYLADKGALAVHAVVVVEDDEFGFYNYLDLNHLLFKMEIVRIADENSGFDVSPVFSISLFCLGIILFGNSIGKTPIIIPRI